MDGTDPHIDPHTVDALEFEAFVLDVVPLTDRWLLVETSRWEEFAPPTNGEGADFG
ncbi:MAG: hypothetical protein IT428_10805 [Planctomycetaceae bacterium]|nr:hypothetical protein [Planctomycetaceae bacterium]